MSGSTSILDSLSPVQPTAGMLASQPATSQQPAPSSGGDIPTVTVRAQKPSNTSVLDSLTPVPPTPGMMAAQPELKSTWGDIGTQFWSGLKRGVIGMANAPLTVLNAEGDLIKSAINSGAGQQVLPDQSIAGLPMPSAPEAKDFAGRAAGRIGEFAAGMPLAAIGGGSVLGNVARQVVPTIAAGIGSQAAEDVAPESLKPLAATAGAFAGAVPTALAQEGVAAVGRAGGRQIGLMGGGSKETVGGVRATGTQIQAAGQQVSQALGPEGRATLDTAGSGEIVPGSQPTTAQIAPTPGAVALDKAHRVANPEPFNAREAQQNTARVGAVQSLAPADARPQAVGELFTNQLDALDKQGQQRIGAAQQGVQQATETLGGGQETGAYGEQIRGALQGAKEPVHAATGRLWAAVDPDGTWALQPGATRDTAGRLLGEISPTAQTDAQETALLQRAAGMPDVVRFRELGDMRADVNAALGRLSGTPGYQPNIRRLTILKGSIDQSISDAMEGKAAQEAQAVASGVMTPEQSMVGRLQGVTSQRAEAGPAGSVPSSAPVGSVGGGRSPLDSGRNGARFTQGAQPVASGRGAAAGNSGLSSTEATERRPESLVDFLIARGGVQDQGGDLRAIGADAIHHKQGGRLVNPRGAPLDYAREAAEEEGFLRPNSTVNDLLDAIGEHASGRPVYRISDQAVGDQLASARREAGRQSEAYDRARAAVETAEADAGARLSDEEMDHAAKMVMQGAHPQQALIDVVRPREDAELTRNASRLGFGQPGIPPAAQQAELSVNRGQLSPNFTQAHADSYRSAVAATRAEKERFGQGGVGKVLRPGRQGEDFAVPSGNVPRQIFTRGPTEPAEVERFINAVGGPQEAAQIGRETLANELRQQNIIKPDGTLDAARFDRWQARRKATIDQFPGLSDQFASAETTQRTLDNVTATHKAALEDFQKSAAAKFISDDPSKAVAAAFGSKNPTATFGQLVRQVRANADAEAGLRRAVVDYITEKTRSATPANETEDFQKAATFRNFVRQNSGALKALFGGQGVQNLDMVSADLRRAAYKASATAGSDTAANTIATKARGLAGHTKHASALGVLALVGEQLGEHLHGGMLGTFAGAVALPLAGELVHSLRQAGIQTVNDLVREAMLHPQLARELMVRADRGIGPVASQRIARTLQSVVVTNAARRPSQETRE